MSASASLVFQRVVGTDVTWAIGRQALRDARARRRMWGAIMSSASPVTQIIAQIVADGPTPPAGATVIGFSNLFSSNPQPDGTAMTKSPFGGFSVLNFTAELC